MVDVFISYPRAMRAKVEPIKAKLQTLGLDVFFDLEGIDGGDIFPDVITRALRTSKSVLCCWSPLYFERPWCLIECRHGLKRGIMVPVALEAFDENAPPADLEQVNWLNLAGLRTTPQHQRRWPRGSQQADLRKQQESVGGLARYGALGGALTRPPSTEQASAPEI